jgi:prepilin-type N-terminal cleavage/methylation domain-containing protein
MTNLKSEIRNLKLRRAFTLMELLIVIGIIAILAALVAVGMAGAVNQARASRTRSQINKIDTLIMEKYESYRTRAVRITPTASAVTNAQLRVTALRELMRLEMPDRISDLCTAVELADLTSDGELNAISAPGNSRFVVLNATPAAASAYRRLAARNMATSGRWSNDFEGAECLYLILSIMKDGDKSAIEFFTPDEIGDVDEDGFKEILDGFGRPILFLRWAPGYSREQPGPDNDWGDVTTDDNGDSIVDNIDEFMWAGTDDILWTSTLQTRDSREAPDPFDPVKSDPRWSNSDPGKRPFALRPLIFSGGLDKIYDVHSPTVDYATTAPFSDPYLGLAASGLLVGTPADSNGDGAISSDNITNHFIEPQ